MYTSKHSLSDSGLTWPLLSSWSCKYLPRLAESARTDSGERERDPETLVFIGKPLSLQTSSSFWLASGSFTDPCLWIVLHSAACRVNISNFPQSIYACPGHVCVFPVTQSDSQWEVSSCNSFSWRLVSLLHGLSWLF